MKKILLFLFLLPLFVVGQNRFTSIDSAKNYSLRYVKNSAVESFTNLRMQNVVYGTLQLLDSLCGAGVIDTIWKSGDTLKYKIGSQLVTVGVFGGSGSNPTLQQVTDQGNSTTDSINIIASSGERVGIFTKGSGGPPNGAYGKLILQSNYTNTKLEFNPNTIFFRVDNTYTAIAGSGSPYNQNNQLSLPDSSGTLPLRVKLNSTTYAPANNGTIDLGATDTATVVKAYVTNAESVTITKGQVVYIFGASGDRASVKLAKNTSDTFSSKTLGIVREDIAAGESGWITTQGQVSGINLGAYTPGDILWLDSIAGSFTATKPQAPYHAVFLGVVERANVGNGLIYVKPQNGVELDELHDVRITSLANNDVIRYNSSLGYWENKSIETTSGVQWTGVDSMLSSATVSNGYHEEIRFITRPYLSNIRPWGNFASGGTTSVGEYTPGIESLILGTSNSVNGGPAIIPVSTFNQHTNTFGNYLSTDYYVFTTRLKVPTLNDGTQRFYVHAGLASITGGYPANAVSFFYDLQGANPGSTAAAYWQTYTSSASNRTWNQNHTQVTVLADTWVNFKIVVNTSVAFFFINGTLVATHTSNIPLSSVALSPYVTIVKTAGSTNRTVEVKYITLDQKYTTPL